MPSAYAMPAANRSHSVGLTTFEVFIQLFAVNMACHAIQIVNLRTIAYRAYREGLL
jgi:hypothetical protein